MMRLPWGQPRGRKRFRDEPLRRCRRQNSILPAAAPAAARAGFCTKAPNAEVTAGIVCTDEHRESGVAVDAGLRILAGLPQAPGRRRLPVPRSCGCAPAGKDRRTPSSALDDRRKAGHRQAAGDRPWDCG
jgi:hypothetical protein